MTPKQIETKGIAYLEDLITDSKILVPYITSNDKTPLWDGEIQIYSKPDHNDKNEFILGRVPIQVRATGSKKNRKKYPIKRDILRKYRNTGGIIFIRPFVTDKKENREIYISLLLPVKIEELLVSKPNNIQISVPFEKIDSIQELETKICFFFKHQNHISIANSEQLVQYFSNDICKIAIATMSNNSSNYEDLFNSNAIVYVIDNFDIQIPTLLKIDEIGISINHQVGVNNTIYFQNACLKLNRNKGKILELNSAISLVLKDISNLNFNFETKGALLEDIVQAALFLEGLHKYKHINIDSRRLDFNAKTSSFESSLFNGWKDILYFLQSQHIPTEKIKNNDLEKEATQLLKLQNMINKAVSFDKDPQKDVFFETFNLLNRRILLFFIKQDTNSYLCENFFNSHSASIRYNKIITSKFITVLNFKEDPAYTDLLFGYEEDMSRDICEKYNHELYSEHLELALFCIKGYDLYQQKHPKNQLLNIALTILEKIEESKTPSDNLDITLIINKLQVKKRLRTLDSQDLEQLYIIKNSIDNQLAHCCIFLLSDNINEFKSTFNKLPKDDQEKFKTWPIWNLYKEDISTL